MKKVYTFFFAVIVTAVGFAQSPQKMSYQAVIRNASGELVKSSPIGMKISILQGSATGTPIYVETQTPTTNANGLVTIEIGGATPVSGTFAGIDWSTGTYFIKTETDPTGGTSYSITGTSQILSVPYALYAKNSENIINVTFSFTGDTMFLGTNKIIIPGISAANQLKDVDGNVYKTVKIGNQIWIAENLKTTKYRNGDLIGTTIPATLDISLEITPKYQWAYGGNESNVATYGRLYTWYAVTDSRNVCPIGWHVPTDAEWKTLTDYLTNNNYGYEGSGTDIAKSMAATLGWTTYGTAGTVGNDQASNNSSGFTALPSGYRLNSGTFNGIGSNSYWWSSTEYSAAGAYGRSMYYNSSGVGSFYDDKQNGFSVRCLRDL
jgi:uncharacterized protein (TIGR02145 family)